ncbi:hypothetical protein A2U01_0081022, partial [Trifolium medium]|nr:hypothetical protein [Trifolium medium]
PGDSAAVETTRSITGFSHISVSSSNATMLLKVTAHQLTTAATGKCFVSITTTAETS